MKFAVLFAGTWPMLGLGDGEGEMGTDGGKKLGIPSVHVQGSEDPWAKEGERLRMEYFDERVAQVVRFKGGHTCPVAKIDAERVVRAVLAAWRLTKTL